MAFVPGYEHDVFVSYVHNDDSPLYPGGTGWVRTLVDTLDPCMRRKLGTNFKLWMDPELAGNQPLTETLLNTLQKTATLLVILSNGYLESKWCVKERNNFLDFVRGHALLDSRVFLVCFDTIDREALPAEFT